MATLSIDGVSKSFGSQQVIPPLSLTIPDGEFCVLVGPSGCGKSTLLRIIAGLEPISTGRILIDGADVSDLDPPARGIAMVFQSYALYPHMDVDRNMGFGLQIARTPRQEIVERVARAAEKLRLGDYLAPAAARALRRSAPARRHRPRDYAEAQALSPRRAALQSRCGASRRHARRDRPPQARARLDDGLRHPRSGRGHDPGRPHRGHEWRPHRAGRLAARALRESGQPVRRRLHRLAGDEFPQGTRCGHRGRQGPRSPCLSGHASIFASPAASRSGRR